MIDFQSIASAFKHRDADILSSGLPICNIGRLIAMRENERTEFGRRMLEARKAAKLTQTQVAKALEISQGTLSELEKSAQGSSKTVEFAKLYGCDPNWLSTGQAVSQSRGAPPPPPGDYADRREVSESDWALLKDIQIVLSDEEILSIRRRAAAAKARALATLEDIQPPSSKKG